MQENDIHHCLMESTGIYWMSLYAILTEVGIEVIVANPIHIKQMPKRKTDCKDVFLENAEETCFLDQQNLFCGLIITGRIHFMTKLR